MHRTVFVRSNYLGEANLLVEPGAARKIAGVMVIVPGVFAKATRRGASP